jgi:hypothetical protein
MGWEVVTADGERQAQLQIGDIGSIILRSKANVQPQEREGRPPLTSVIDHIA